MAAKKYLIVTPVKHPLKIEVPEGTHNAGMTRALMDRITKRGTEVARPLTKHQDAEFLAGMVSIAALRYPGDILKMVLEADEVQLSLEVVPDPDANS